MSQYRCHACDIQITSLTSQKNGNLDTCLQCAIEAAPFVRYTLKRRSEVLDDVILCQSHYQEDRASLLQSLTEREIAAGMTQDVRPCSGVYGCRTCNSAPVAAVDLTQANALPPDQKEST